MAPKLLIRSWKRDLEELIEEGSPPRDDEIHLVCEMCGDNFTEYDWTYESRVVPFCPRCSHWVAPTMCGFRLDWLQHYGAVPLGPRQLMFRQLTQINSALMALESECKTRS